MKSRLAIFFLAFGIATLIYGCGGKVTDENGVTDSFEDDAGVVSENVSVTDDIQTENSCPYALMYNGVTYYYTDEYIFEDIEVSDKDILGSVTSVIPESGMPQVNGQANIPIEGSVFIKHELAYDGLLVLIQDKWYIFETRN